LPLEQVHNKNDIRLSNVSSPEVLSSSVSPEQPKAREQPKASEQPKGKSSSRKAVKKSPIIGTSGKSSP
ncbi:345_t:CDS:1, partial [Funneliformis geosporum]